MPVARDEVCNFTGDRRLNEFVVIRICLDGSDFYLWVDELGKIPDCFDLT